MLISVYTDGSCSNNGEYKGQGSFGYVITAVRDGKQIIKVFSSKLYTGTTNQRMELSAIITALENIDPGHSINIYSDSEYCIKGINNWLSGWIKSNQLDKKANTDLWKKFIKVKNSHKESKLKFTWVRGHNGNKFNEMADRLSRVGRHKNLKKHESKFLRV